MPNCSAIFLWFFQFPFSMFFDNFVILGLVIKFCWSVILFSCICFSKDRICIPESQSVLLENFRPLHLYWIKIPCTDCFQPVPMLWIYSYLAEPATCCCVLIAKYFESSEKMYLLTPDIQNLCHYTCDSK